MQLGGRQIILSNLLAVRLIPVELREIPLQILALEIAAVARIFPEKGYQSNSIGVINKGSLAPPA